MKQLHLLLAQVMQDKFPHSFGRRQSFKFIEGNIFIKTVVKYMADI